MLCCQINMVAHPSDEKLCGCNVQGNTYPETLSFSTEQRSRKQYDSLFFNKDSN
ncbi:hypothetical protein NT01EI_0978 [Edwardsiella ictaluri 93-146]|uniref:Uncharacterized protein n=1 Tax=Edwardsiella ictaluri (strain 93-146) TaxID=634503 RepID=C5BBF7_EDWI9|nr:hypothetical protein NT01EI_0978 [Edwardsiella ictaluri 93-146]